MTWKKVFEQQLAARGGVASRAELLRIAPRTVLDGQVGRGALQRVFPHVYASRDAVLTDQLVLCAALRHAGSGAAISHVSALHLWGVRRLTRPVHLTVDQSMRRAGAQGLVVHRRNGFEVERDTCVVSGLPVTTLPRSVVDAWPLLPLADRRPLLLDLVREKRVSTRALRASLAERPNVGGHRALAQTVDLAEDGCHSELEAMGVLNVFRHHSLPRSVGQLRMQLDSGRIWLDRAWPEVKLAVELDGARFHTDPEARRRDLARDSSLAALGWVVLRFTYADVLRDPDGVRARVLAVYQARARQLAHG